MRLVRTAAIALAVLAAFPAWSSGSKEGPAPAPAKKTVLTVWEHTPQFEAPLKGVIEAFAAKNPDIAVEYEIKTPDQYYALLSTAIQAGEAPDLFWTNGTATTDLANLVKQEAVMDLTGKVDVSGYPGMSLAMTRLGGRSYLTPGASIDTRAVFYNKDIFAKHGVAVPKTLAEFEAALAKFKAAGVVPISLGGRFTWSILFHFEPILAAVAPDWLDEAVAGKARVTDPRVAAAFEKMLEWGRKGYYGPGYLGADEGGQLLAFSMGQSAMTLTGSWNADTLRKNNPDLKVGAFQIPTADGRRPMVVTYSTGFCVYSKTKKAEAALRLANFMASKEAQQIWVSTLNVVPGLPGLKSADSLVSEIVDTDIQVGSFYSILGAGAKPGATPPTQIWEQDNVKLLAGLVDVPAFLASLDASLR